MQFGEAKAKAKETATATATELRPIPGTVPYLGHGPGLGLQTERSVQMILVVGATGYLGEKVAERLLLSGEQVRTRSYTAT